MGGQLTTYLSVWYLHRLARCAGTLDAQRRQSGGHLCPFRFFGHLGRQHQPFTNTAIGYPPCTAQACLEILKYYNVPLSGKRAVVVGRSLVVGKPAAMMLDRENATVTLCNSRTRNLPELCKQADIVVVAMGKMAAVGADCLRAGQTVVDVGIHVNEEGKLCGDVQFAAAEPVVDAITPVPGGVGTVTTSVLVGHVVQAAAKKAGL